MQGMAADSTPQRDSRRLSPATTAAKQVQIG